MSGLGLSDPVNTSGVAGPSSSSCVDWHSPSRASYILYRGTSESEVGREGFHLLPEQGFHFLSIFSFLWSYCFLPAGGRIQETLDRVFFSGGGSCLREAGSTSLSPQCP